ncbi:MAG: radical SAM family heme chaperone HemW [Prevotella sp.]|nr:radical SAM family heme chaperone HemW [Prevotella sp.]
MAGLYIHIPFCKSRCVYCAFYSTTRLNLCKRYVEALNKEMLLRKEETQQTISTIYLGGGTPSVLPMYLLKQLFIYINNVYKNRVGEPEVTLECNPDDVTDAFVEGLRQLPVNRISMGVQTFDNKRLTILRRRHKSEQVAKAVEKLRQAGIRNISIDLIYGFPCQTLNEWEDDLDKALKLNVEHISAYALSYEEGTPLWQMLQDRLVEELDEETQRQMYYRLIERLELNGFEHYEISNFAKPGFRSRHNSSYWNHTPYIGLGAGAHSYSNNRRTWNVADIDNYIDSIEHGMLPADGETLDLTTLYNEQVMINLRTSAGLNLDSLSPDNRDYCLGQAETFIKGKLLAQKANSLVLTSDGLFVSDMVIAHLMKA